MGSSDACGAAGWWRGGHVDVSGAISGGVKMTNCALMVPDGVYQLELTYSHLSHVREQPAGQ